MPRRTGGDAWDFAIPNLGTKAPDGLRCRVRGHQVQAPTQPLGDGGGVCDGLAVRGNLIAMTNETFLFGLGLVRARLQCSTARS